jgi:hypothetical protein
MRIATWNIERSKSNTAPRSRSVLSRIQEIAADIWILTGTHDAICPDSGYDSVSTPTVTEAPIRHAVGEYLSDHNGVFVDLVPGD